MKCIPIFITLNFFLTFYCTAAQMNSVSGKDDLHGDSGAHCCIGFRHSL
jgi:hypothetical protein